MMPPLMPRMTRPVALLVRGLAIAVLLAVAVLAQWPLRLAGLAGTGLTAQSVTGSIWHGRLAAAQLHGLALNDIAAGLAPLPLLGGTLRVDFAGGTISGALLRARDGGGVTGLTGRIFPGPIAGLPITAIDLDGVGLGFARGLCTVSTGRITVQPGGMIAGQGALAGTPRCDGAALLVPLVSASGRTRLDIRAMADGRYRVTLAIDAATEAERPALLAAGFQPTPSGLAMTAEGKL